MKSKRQKILSVVLSLVMLFSLLPVRAVSTGNPYQAKELKSDYFYNQLNERAKAIYDRLLSEFTTNAENYYSGKKIIDLMGLEKDGKKVISESDVQAYVQAGNKDIFNDFCAAKDALDLDHSELWYIDSGYLTFQVTNDTSNYHVLIGPGRGETYLLAGKTIEGLKDKIEETNDAINEITGKALRTLEAAEERAGQEFSEQDRKAALITSVHDQITANIHYRYETECRTIGSAPHANAKYIRTLYGIVTHEGVCEAYARTLQVCLNRLGVECVLIHGVQSKGTPEDHMWNAVNIPEEGEEHWYVVDATWDDPLTANWDGTRDLSFHEGLDGKETNTYLMVGQSLVGEYWNPSGYVSTGNFEFKYPTIETEAYSGIVAYGDDNGLKVKYSAGGSQEDGVPAGVYTATYKGMNATEAAKNKYYFLIKMYDYHPDGTADVMEEWYYANATLLLSADNHYIGDFNDGFRFMSPTCEYVEIAVTTLPPDHFDEWSDDPTTSYLSKHFEAGYYHGDESDIIAQSGMLYNVNASYEAPPYVVTQTPAPNGNATAGYDYRFKVTYDDDLYHILPNDENARNGIATTADVNFYDNYDEAKSQTVQVRYTTNQQDLHSGGVVTTQVSGELPFDTNRDGIVDMTDGYTDFKWIYKSDSIEDGGQGVRCPNEAYHATNGGSCSVEAGCPIVGVEFNFRASNQWIDDVTEYNFTIEGVVGSRSRKFANNFSVIATVPGLCPACYRSQGIDWNLWGQPTLLDAPENLDLYNMAVSGGTDQETLEALSQEMNTSDLNGRLMLVVENKSRGAGNREEYEKIDNYLEESGQLDGSIMSSSVFEINFNRLCPMVKLKPNQGQSLRVQVGYPTGVTYESLGSGQVELKAYHFTRCAPENEKEHPCSNTNKENHKWGDDIVAVDEITVVPTPYGMVIMCNAFSPFEIVAVKKTGAAAKVATEKTLVVVSDSNGTVEYNNGTEVVSAVGENGNVKFDADTSKTFTVKPRAGYTVNTVSLDGNAVALDGKKFTVKAPQKDAVLNVTFVPITVKEDEKAYGTAVVAAVCTHEEVVTADEPGHTAKPATCTESGYVLGTVCAKCGQTITKGHEIPATGHTIDKSNPSCYTEGKDPTCTESGTRNYIKCTTCGEVLSQKVDLPALGHIFSKSDSGETVEITCQGRTYKATCTRKDCGDTETLIDTSEEIRSDHKFEEIIATKPAACTENATNTLKCKWCDNTEIQIVDGSATGHDFNEQGLCKKCRSFACTGGHTIIETPAKNATCTEDGHTAGKKCSICGYWQEKEQRILATGHSFDGHSKGSKCKVCGYELTSNSHTPVLMEEISATCTADGRMGGRECSVCGEIIVQPEVIPATGHDWDSGSAKWTWSNEGGFSASVTLTCKTDPTHQETFAAEVSQPSVSKVPTCTQEGAATYTATFKVGNGIVSDTKNVTLPITEHRFGSEPIKTNPATCTHHAEKIYECTMCGLKNTVVEEGELLSHEMVLDPLKSSPAGCTTEGTNVNVCAVCHQEISQTIPAKGHTYENGAHVWVWSDDCTSCTVTISCSECGETISPSVTVSSKTVKNATCTEKGETVYTATAVLDGLEHTDTRTVSTDALGHKAEKVAAKNATATEAGNIAYWYCEKCGKYFEDEALTEELTKAQTVIPATGTNGSDSGSNSSSDSVGNQDDEEIKSPQTGDDNHWYIWLFLMLSSGGMLALLASLKKRHLSN